MITLAMVKIRLSSLRILSKTGYATISLARMVMHQSTYLVAEKIGPGKYREINVNADGEASQLIINGDSATLQSRYVGKVVDSIVFMKK